MDEHTDASPSPIERLQMTWHSARLWLIFLGGLLGTTLTISLPLAQRQVTIGVEVREVAPFDIRAPFALSYTSEFLTQQARQAAEDGVQNAFFPPDNAVARQQLERMAAALDFIEAVRADSHSAQDQKLADLAALADVRVDAQMATTLLEMPETRWAAVRLEATSVLEQVLQSEIREDRLEEARRTVPALVSISMPESQAQVVAQLATAFVAPNAHFDEAATEAARQRAREAVAPVVKSYAAGETIVGQGQVVSPLHIEALQEFGLLQPSNPWVEVAIRGLLVTLLGCALVLYAYRVHADQLQSVRRALVISLLFIAIGGAMQFMMPGRTVLPYLFPAATMPMLMAVLFSPGMGIVTSLATGALAGFLAPRGLELALYIALSGSMGALMIGQADRISTFFWAGLASAMAAFSVVIVFRFPDPATDLVGKASIGGAAFLNGLLSASLGFALVLLISNALGETTSLQLVELSRPDHPLLQLVLRSAPGTYQHSLQVANLAEQAGRAIGANALLVRVGSLYHDVGKSLRPQFFIENQIPGQNIHDQLDPTTSASVIISHVRDGLELARRYRLPKRIRSFIAEHHGTMVSEYQYGAAVEAASGDASRVDIRDFRYPGPRPRTRETALVMLADAVESKARADMPKDEEEIDVLVQWVIQDRLSKGQLNRTNLTLKDLDSVKLSFAKTLRGMYHPRIRYPDTSPEPESIEPLKAPAATQPDPR